MQLMYRLITNMYLEPDKFLPLLGLKNKIPIILKNIFKLYWNFLLISLGNPGIKRPGRGLGHQPYLAPGLKNTAIPPLPLSDFIGYSSLKFTFTFTVTFLSLYLHFPQPRGYTQRNLATPVYAISTYVPNMYS
jgi:hypothetical protein